MRGSDERTGSLFSYVDLEDRVPAKHPLRVIRCIVNDVLAALDGEFAKIYAESGRPSIPPERLLRARSCCRRSILTVSQISVSVASGAGMGNARASWRERPPISGALLQSSSELQVATADPLDW
jgi:hypothetical protein